MRYDKKTMKICENLGAEKFQKIVFFVEKIKYYILEKIPSIVNWYISYTDKIRDKKLKKCKTESEQKKVLEKYRLNKLSLKKELIRKENRNYHLDINHPNDIKKYLENNKKIHLDSLNMNIVLTIVLSLLMLFFSNPVILTLIIYELFSGIINFQCINLQNYNLCRLEDEKTKSILKKLENKRSEEFKLNMDKGAKVVGDAFKKSIDIPTIDDIINNITSLEEVNQLLNYSKKHLESLKSKEIRERKKTL